MIATNPNLPELYDRSVAAKTASLFCLVSAFWFLITPLTFFGVSAEKSGLELLDRGRLDDAFHAASRQPS